MSYPYPVAISQSFYTAPVHTDPDLYTLRCQYPSYPVSPRRSYHFLNRLAYVEALVGGLRGDAHSEQRQTHRFLFFFHVDMNALMIETIWRVDTLFSSTSPSSIVPLRSFIQEVLKRSRTTYSTLQTALFYLFRARPAITAHLYRTGRPYDQRDAYIGCGRRMFLASLLLASKFVQDKTYRNSAWAKIAGLPVAEINAAERHFLELIQYRLFIAQPTFDEWHQLLHAQIQAKTNELPVFPETAMAEFGLSTPPLSAAGSVASCCDFSPSLPSSPAEPPPISPIRMTHRIRNMVVQHQNDLSFGKRSLDNDNKNNNNNGRSHMPMKKQCISLQSLTMVIQLAENSSL